MTPDQEIDKGRRAARFLADAEYQEAWTVLRDRLVTLLAQDQPDDKRDRLVADLKAHHRVRAYLEQVAIGGKMAAEQVEREKTFAERMKARIRA